MSITQIKNSSLCIEATAGSGKTTLMVERIKDLIINQQVPPDQCLAITFTDKAAKEMSDRLIATFIQETSVTWPISDVSRIQISTIHSFCQTILKKYALCMDGSPHYRIINSIEKYTLIKETIDELLQTFRMKPTEWIKDCFGTWSVEQINQILTKAYDNRDTINYWLNNGFYELDEMPDDKKDSQFSLMTKEKYNAVKSLISQFLKNIDQKKDDSLLLDYDDLLFRTYQLLSNVDWLRHQIQNHKQHIFVDEFQDTSPIQWKIVQLLCDDNDPYKKSKLWLVGDRCQAIYGFRGADDQLMEMVLSTKHDQLTHVKNTNNYRSHPIIINFINQLFTRLFNAQNQSFLAMEPKKEETGSASIQLKIVDSETPNQEFNEIYAMINQWKSAGFKYNDMAILVRKNYDIKRIKEYFSSKNVPLQINKGSGLCEMDSVQIIINFLKGLLNPNDDIAWYSIATDILGISNEALITEKSMESVKDRALKYRKNTIDEWQSLILSGQLNKQLVKCVLTLAINDQFSQQDKQAIQQFMTAFSDVLESSERPMTAGLDWLNYCIEHPKSMGIDQDSQLDAVQVMTLHAAKGLEFPIIIVPFLDAQFNFGATDPLILSRQKGMGLSIPGFSKENHVRKEIFEHQKSEGLLEELRLFYVTLTRAKQHIAMTGKHLKRKNSSRLTLCLPYLQETESGGFDFNFNYQKYVPGKIALTNNNVSMKTNINMSINTIIPKKYQTFWSISNILDYQSCPKMSALKKYRTLDVGVTDDQEKGNIKHQWAAKIIMDDLCDLDSPEFLAFKTMFINKEWFSSLNGNGKFFVEYPFEYQYKEHTIRGRFDAIWFDDNQKKIKILEFKLSIGENSQRYANQLHFYADILREKYPNYSLTPDDCMLIDFQTCLVIPIAHPSGSIHDILDDLPNTKGPFIGNSEKCSSCQYADKISNCETDPFMLNS